MRLLNQHSYVLVSLMVLGAVWLVARKLTGPLRFVAIGLALVVVVAAAAWLRTGSGDIGGTTDLDRALAQGQPVALEFYSNF